jgi:hypothetical protein
MDAKLLDVVGVLRIVADPFPAPGATAAHALVRNKIAKLEETNLIEAEADGARKAR